MQKVRTSEYYTDQIKEMRKKIQDACYLDGWRQGIYLFMNVIKDNQGTVNY